MWHRTALIKLTTKGRALPKEGVVDNIAIAATTDVTAILDKQSTGNVLVELTGK